MLHGYILNGGVHECQSCHIWFCYGIFQKWKHQHHIFWHDILVSTKYKINTKYKIIEVFITCVGLSMICVYPADDVRGSFCRLVALVMLSFHQFVQRALKSPVTIEQIGNSSFI